MTAPLLVAADVGNSKTHVAVADEAGRLLGVATGPGASPQTLGEPAALAVVRDLARQVTGVDTGYAQALLAVAGVDLPEHEVAYERAAHASTIAANVVVCNDTMALLRSGTDGPDGIAVVAGAGTNCVGRYRDRVVRFHSLGRLTGDWGGGNDLGEEAVGAACRAEDGRGPDTLLAQLVPAYFGLQRPLQVAEAVHRGDIAASRLTELAPLVLSAAVDGDVPAQRLVDRLIDEVVAFVVATTARLGCSLAEVPIVLGGGLLRSGNRRLSAGIQGRLTALDSGARIRTPEAPPILGALALAYDAHQAGPPVALDDLAGQVLGALAASW